MALTLSTLQGLKLAQLRSLATVCGLSSGTGTKASRISVIHSALSDSKSAKTLSQQPLRIVSIDMGIRNLAYCVLSLAPLSDLNTKTPASKPSVLAWNRLAVSKSEAEKKESFHPADYAIHAYELLTKTLLAYHPTHVLIERQRTRTMGGSAVQEWTMRVNMLESQLYAVLHTLDVAGKWNGKVEGISPAKVAATWLDQGKGTESKAVEDTKGRAKGAGAKRKREKIQVVGRWLQSGKEVDMGNPKVEGTRMKFLAALQGRKSMTQQTPMTKSKRVTTTSDSANARQPEADEWEPSSKLDDMADCLLQGVAWIRWEENRRRIRLEGVGALEDMISNAGSTGGVR